MRFFAPLAVALAWTSSASAWFTITSPNSTVGWNAQGTNFFTFTFFPTDLLNFTVVLQNENTTLFPPTILLNVSLPYLKARQSSALNSTTLPIHAPCPLGFPIGNGFQLSFAPDPTRLTDHLAQSSNFAVKGGGAACPAAGGTTTTGTTTTGTTTTGTGTTSTHTAPGSTGTSSQISSSSNAALPMKSEFTDFLSVGLAAIMAAFLV